MLGRVCVYFLPVLGKVYFQDLSESVTFQVTRVLSLLLFFWTHFLHWLRICLNENSIRTSVVVSRELEIRAGVCGFFSTQLCIHTWDVNYSTPPRYGLVYCRPQIIPISRFYFAEFYNAPSCSGVSSKSNRIYCDLLLPRECVRIR